MLCERQNIMIRAGVSTASLYPMVTEQALNELAIRGVDCVEIFLNSDCELKKDFINGLKSTLDSFNISVSSIHPYTCGIEPMMFFTQYPRRFLDILDYYKKYFEIMNLLGAKIFVFHGNKPQNAFPEEQYFERFKGLSDLGKTFGITVAQENVARCSSGNLDFLKRMAQALENDAKFVLDTKQAVRKGYNPYEFVEALNNKIVHIHISDFGDKGDCLLVGQGNLDFNNFLKKLTFCSYTGSIILELYSNGYKNVDELIDNYVYIKKNIKNVCGN